MMESLEAVFEKQRAYYRALDSESLASSSESFDLTVCLPEHGFMEARLSIGTDCFELVFSDVYTPFMDWLDWLEKVATLKVVEPFSWHDEYFDYVFELRNVENSGYVDLVFYKLLGQHLVTCRHAIVSRLRFVMNFFHVYKFLNGFQETWLDDEFTIFSFEFLRNCGDVFFFDDSRLLKLLVTAQASVRVN